MNDNETLKGYIVTFIHSDADNASYLCDTIEEAQEMLYENFELMVSNYNELVKKYLESSLVKYINNDHTVAEIEYIEKENGYTETTNIFVTPVYE
jgi:hypothetical protein